MKARDGHSICNDPGRDRGAAWHSDQVTRVYVCIFRELKIALCSKVVVVGDLLTKGVLTLVRFCIFLLLTNPCLLAITHLDRSARALRFEHEVFAAATATHIRHALPPKRFRRELRRTWRAFLRAPSPSRQAR